MRQREEWRREKRQESTNKKRRGAHLAAQSVRCKVHAEARYVRCSSLGYMEDRDEFICGRKRKRSLLSAYEGALDASPLVKRRTESSLVVDGDCALFIQPVLLKVKSSHHVVFTDTEYFVKTEVTEDELWSSSSDTLVESFAYIKADNVKDAEVSLCPSLRVHILISYYQLMEIDHQSPKLVFPTVDTLCSPLAPTNGEIDSEMVR